MANPYSEAWSRGEVEKDQQTPYYGTGGAIAGGLVAAHYVGKAPAGGYREAWSAAREALKAKDGTLGSAWQAGKTALESQKTTINEALKGADKAVAAAAKNTADTAAQAAAKTAKTNSGILRAGKWGAVAGAALVTGTVVAGVAGEKIKRRAQRNELAAQSWVGYEESRRSMGGGLAR
jgi:hypothetical protein